jgi:RNA-dependent RNA polymerase
MSDSFPDAPFLIWDPLLVEPFRNSALVEPPQDFISKNFERNVVKVEDFFRQSCTPKKRELDFLDMLLHGLSDTKVGLYSNYHDISVFKDGYAHPKSVHYAYMYAARHVRRAVLY